MIRSMRIMLLPNKKQATKMTETANVARYAYNWAVGKQIEHFEEKGKYISESDLRSSFTKHKDEKKWLYNVSNNAAKQAIKDACKAFDRFIEEKKKPNYKPYSKKKIDKAARKGKTLTRYDMHWHPKFKLKGKAEPKFYMDTSKIEFTSTHVKLEKIANKKRKNRSRLNWIKLAEKLDQKPDKRYTKTPSNKKYTNPRVKFDGMHWWISVGIEDKGKSDPLGSEGVGIDVGIKELAVCSDGNKYKNINKTKKVRKLKKKQRRLQRKISRKYKMNKEGESYKKTSNIIKSEKKLLKLNRRLTGIRHDYLHQVTTEIIRRKPSYIVIEDLNVKGMMKNKHLSKAVQDQCLYEFSRQIEYKCNWNNIKFIKADRYYPSSKRCIECGNIKKDLKLSERIYKCKCGNVLDRDYQASINLKMYGEGEA